VPTIYVIRDVFVDWSPPRRGMAYERSSDLQPVRGGGQEGVPLSECKMVRGAIVIVGVGSEDSRADRASLQDYVTWSRPIFSSWIEP